MSDSFPVSPQVLVPQDLHIHTTYSKGDSSVVPEQTIELVTRCRHADILGVSDHLEDLTGDIFPRYAEELRAADLYVGVEVNGSDWTREAVEIEADYYVYHCRDRSEDYRGAERLAQTGKPVIISHPLHFDTDLDRLAPECVLEINNRYIWRYDWKRRFRPFLSRFRFVVGSDAHQPHWLNQNVARRVAVELGIREVLLFSPAGAAAG
jgi:hypothetical protein